MEKRPGSNLGKVFIATLIVSSVVVGAAYVLAGYEVAVLFGICWLAAVTAAVAVGIENVIKGHD